MGIFIDFKNNCIFVLFKQIVLGEETCFKICIFC